MTYPETLPGTPVNAGDTDHISDHGLLRTAVSNIDSRLHSVEVIGPGTFVPVGSVIANNLVCDGNTVKVTTTAGSTTITATGLWRHGSSFSPSDVGKTIHIDQGYSYPLAGNSIGNGWIKTTILTYVSPTQVTIGIAPNQSRTDTIAIFGTNNDPLLSAHLAALLPYQRLYLPAAGGESSPFYFLPNGGHTVSNKGGGIVGPSGLPLSSLPMFVTTHLTNNAIEVGEPGQRYANFAVRHGAKWSLGDTWIPRGIKPISPVAANRHSAPTAGAGFFQGPTDLPDAYWFATEWENVDVSGMWDGIVIGNGPGNTIKDCWLYQNIHTCLEVDNWYNTDVVALTIDGLTHGGSWEEYTGMPGHGIHLKTFGGARIRKANAWGGRFPYLFEISGLSTNFRFTDSEVDDFGHGASNPSGSGNATATRLGIDGGGVVFVSNSGSASAILASDCYVGTIWNPALPPVTIITTGNNQFINMTISDIMSNYTASGCSVKIIGGTITNLAVLGCGGGRTAGSSVIAPAGHTWREA